MNANAFAQAVEAERDGSLKNFFLCFGTNYKAPAEAVGQNDFELVSDEDQMTDLILCEWLIYAIFGKN